MTILAQHRFRPRSARSAAPGALSVRAALPVLRIAAVMLLMLPLAPVSGQQSAQAREEMRILVSEQAGDEARLAAAESYLRRDLARGQRRDLIRLLTEPESSVRIRRTLLTAMSRSPMLHDEFAEPLARLVAVGDERQRPLTLRAIASVPSPDAARVLVEHAAPFMPAEVVAASVEGLIRMTGRDDLGDDHDAWTDWLDRHAKDDADEWRQELIRGLSNRNIRLTARLAQSEASTTDAYKRLFLISPFQDRGPLLAEMLRAGPSLRKLGIELLYRELSQNRSIDPAVGVAALEMLGSPDPATRAEAARLTATLSPDGAGTRLTRALEIETDPASAAAMLAACARWPRVAAVAPAMRWLDFGGATRAEAATLLLALDTEGLLTDPAHRRRCAGALRAAGPQRLTPDGIRLSVRTGNEDDRESISTLLRGGEPTARTAAASELARRPEFADRVIAAAADDPSLYGAAVAATASHRATADGYTRLRELPAPSPDAKRAGLLAVTRTMPPAEVLTIARGLETDPAMRIVLLAAVGNAATSDEERRIIDAAHLLLAETQLEVGRPDDALATLALVRPSQPDDADRSAFNALRVTALIWLNRLDEADTIEANADVWLRAIERIENEPHAPVVAARTLARFADVLSTNERNLLRSTAALAETAIDTAPETTGGG